MYHRTSQVGDIPNFSHPVKDYCTQKVRLRFPERPLRRLHDHHPCCSVPVIPPASSRAGLSVSASLLLLATGTWCAALSLPNSSCQKKKPARCSVVLALGESNNKTIESIKRLVCCTTRPHRNLRVLNAFIA